MKKITDPHFTTQIFTRSTAKLLHRTTFLMDKAAEKTLQDKVGIGLSQFLTLMQMSSGQHCQRELASALGVTPAAISRQVSNLIDQGFLQKIEHENDRRFEFLILSPAGKKTFAKATEVLESEFSSRYAALSVTDRRQIHDSLMKLMNCFDPDTTKQARPPDK